LPPVVLFSHAYRLPLAVAVPEARNPIDLVVLLPVAVVPSPKLYIPLDAVVERLAPPTCVVVVPAAEKVPTLRTSEDVDVADRSTLKFAGRVAVAEVPVALKSSV